MNIENKTILITGANRGIGRALVDEALGRGIKIFPDPASLSLAEGWRNGALKALELQFSAFLPASPAKAA